MNPNIENLLNTCLEIEGLLCLVARRGDGYPENVIALLKDKTSDLCSAINDLGACLSVPEPADLDVPQPVIEVEQKPCDDQIEETIVELTPDVEEDLDLEAPLNGDNIDIAPLDGMDEISVNLDKQIEEAPCGEFENELSQASSTEFDDTDDAMLIVTGEGDSHPATINELHSTPESHPTPTRNDRVAVELTINDKFRFRRELFSNNDAELAEALQIAAEMSSAEEVEDYFYNDLCFDAESEVVKDFMRIVTSRFPK